MVPHNVTIDKNIQTPGSKKYTIGLPAVDSAKEISNELNMHGKQDALFSQFHPAHSFISAGVNSANGSPDVVSDSTRTTDADDDAR